MMMRMNNKKKANGITDKPKRKFNPRLPPPGRNHHKKKKEVDESPLSLDKDSFPALGS